MVAPRVTASLEIDRSKPCVYVFTRRVQRTGRARCELNAIDAHVPLSMIRWSHAPWQQYNLYMCMTAWMDNNAARIDAAVHPTDLKELASSAGRGSRPIDEGISYQITSSIHKKKQPIVQQFLTYSISKLIVLECVLILIWDWVLGMEGVRTTASLRSFDGCVSLVLHPSKKNQPKTWIRHNLVQWIWTDSLFRFVVLDYVTSKF